MCFWRLYGVMYKAYMAPPGGIEPRTFHPTFKDRFRRPMSGQGVSYMLYPAELRADQKHTIEYFGGPDQT